MRHRRLRRKLGVTTQHRRALLRNLIRHLVIRRRIQTTYAKAKEASAFADSMVQLAKRGGLHARRTLISRLGHSDTAHTLITQIAPHFKDRNGGYTRVLRLKTRVGDGAEMALLEFTAAVELPQKSKKPKKIKKEKEVSKEEETVHEKPKKEEKTKAKDPKDKGKTPEVSEEKKTAAPEEKKESEKKGGFLSALRKFLKGDEESH